ncbi:MAG: hypothetical protein U0Z75_06020 [Deinococcaceae bacterium]
MAQHKNAFLYTQFEQLRQQHKLQKAQIQTRSDQFAQSKNRELLEKAADYTVDAIIKGTANLQLEIGVTVTQLEEKLSNEALKLEELVGAITVAERELEELRKVRLAADALFVLKQEHTERLRLLEAEYREHNLRIEKEQFERRREWEKEARDFDAQQHGLAVQLKKNREQEEANYNYHLERTRQQDADKHADTERELDRDLNARREVLEKDWQERQEELELNEAKYQENKIKIEAFPALLEESVRKAREESIREATSEAKIKSDLLEKEWEATKQGFELQLEALTHAFEANETEIAEIQAQLQKTLEQAQTLAGRAFKGGEV